MFAYYTCIIVISCITMVILSLLVWDNNRFTMKKKISFIHVYLAVMVAAMAEWASLYLNGADTDTIFLHKLVKCLDYCITPMSAFFLSRQFSEKYKYNTVLLNIQIINCIIQVISIFTGWTFYIDEANTYQHGDIYLLYIIVYILTFIVCTYEIVKYAMHFKRRNLLSLILIFLLMFICIILHEILPPEYRITYLGSAIGLSLLFIHYSEFYQQRSDDLISYQDNIIRTDSMTGLLNRYSYNELQKHYLETPPEQDLVVFSIDINGLKKINDNMGHEAGDELITGSADCIKKVFSPYGKCFRTGGDEFICVVHMPRSAVSGSIATLQSVTKAWKGKYQDNLFLAIGYACECDSSSDISLTDLIKISDNMMYQDKEAFYEKNPEYRRT